jgi:imidazolonepropionase-like amidohydrolase
MIWLVGGQIYDVQAAVFRRLDMAMEAGVIVEQSPHGKPEEDDAIIDARGRYLLPGLIDCHVHLTIRSEDADPAAAATRGDAAVALYAAEAAERTLLGGVTTVRDVGGWNYVEMALRDAVAQGLSAGPRMFLAGRLLSITTGGADYYPGMYEVANGPDDVRAAVRKQFARGADLIKVMATGAMLSPQNEDARAVQYTPEELRTAVQTAADSFKRVAAHAHARQGILNAVEAGVASIEHGTFADEAVLRLMAERGTFLVPTMCTGPPMTGDPALAAAVPDHLRKRLLESQSIHRETVRLAHSLGVPIAMGTDAGTPGNHHGRNAEECVLMVDEAGMTPQDAIRAATINAARLLGQEGRLGALSPGMLADVIGVDGDPTGDITELTRVALVVKGGKVVRNEWAV